MKKSLACLLALCMVLAGLMPAAAAEHTYIYLRPANFASSTGTWTVMTGEAGALEGICLKGTTEKKVDDNVCASAQITLPGDGEYYVWARGMDHETVPGTRHFQVGLGEFLMPKKMGAHGVSGYVWEQAGSCTLSAGKQFVKLIDTSGYYARCDAILVTDDKDFVPAEDATAILAEVKKYQPDPSETSVTDTAIPTKEGNAPTAQTVKPAQSASAAQSGQVGKPMAQPSGNTLIMNINQANFFQYGEWLPSSRGQNGGLYTIKSGASAIWNPNLIKPVTAKVSFWGIVNRDEIEHNDNKMTFEIYHNGKIDKKEFDSANFQKDDWVEIGTYDFAGSGDEFIRFNKTTGDGYPNCSRIAEVKLEATSGALQCATDAPKEPELPNSIKSGEVLIKVGDTGYFEAGSWAVSKTKGFADGQAKASAIKKAVVAYHPNIAAAQQVTIQVYNNPVAEFGKIPATNAQYTVVHDGKSDIVTVDMNQPEGWISLGTFAFAGTGDEYVSLMKTDDDPNTIVRADAVRFSAPDGVVQGTEKPAKPAEIAFKAEPYADQSVIFKEDEVTTFAKNTAYFSPSEAMIVAQDLPGYEELKGTWYPSGLAGYFNNATQQNTSSRYSFDFDAVAFWSSLGMTGDLEVSIYKLVHENSDIKAKIEVHHAGKTETFYMDFTAGTPGWVSLGVYDFDGSEGEGVYLSNNETMLTCRANAVRYEKNFVPVEKLDENGKEISQMTVSSQEFNRCVEIANAQALNAENHPESSIDFQYAEDGVRVIYEGSNVIAAKAALPEGYLALNTNIGKCALPLSEIAISDGQQLVAEMIKSDAPIKDAVSDTTDFSFYVQDGDQKIPFTTKNKPIEITVYGDTPDKVTTALMKEEDGALVFVPAFIDGQGAFGENTAPYVGYSFEQKLNNTKNPIFAMGKLNGSAKVAIVKGNITMPDMAGHWAQEDVDLMASKGLVSGRGDGYDPDAQITRAEFTALLTRAAGLPMQEAEDAFTDIADAWYTENINAAKAAGFYDGMPFGDAFEPNKPITRQEMSMMILNAMKCVGKYKNTLVDPAYYLKAFSDQADIDDWAKTAIAKAYEAGIIAGIEVDGVLTFAPQETSTRAQAAAMLNRFVNLDAYVGPLANDGVWEMTFEEEFDGDKLDRTVWDSVNGPHSHINSARYPENVEIRDGKAYLVTRHEEKGGKQWTSASIWTKEFDQTYGYFEAKYKYPNGESMNINNAFWLFKSMINVNDTKYYEIDINEGRMPNLVMTAEHWSDENMQNRTSRYVYTMMTDDLREDYHIFGFEWNEDYLIWYVDGREIRRKRNDVSHHPMQVYLSTAVMNEATMEELLKDADGTSMVVEYVRVYQKKK